jgi:hypothetical protein
VAYYSRNDKPQLSIVQPDTKASSEAEDIILIGANIRMWFKVFDGTKGKGSFELYDTLKSALSELQ